MPCFSQPQSKEEILTPFNLELSNAIIYRQAPPKGLIYNSTVAP